jgi:hypothetical protein
MSYDDCNTWPDLIVWQRHDEIDSWPVVAKVSRAERAGVEDWPAPAVMRERHLPLVRDDADVWVQLATLAAEWRNATMFISSESERTLHPAYLRIIGFGDRALPFLIDQLSPDDSDWYAALMAITGADPVPVADRGNSVAMHRAWTEWFRRMDRVAA